jgi:signal recognition particle GTPase
MLVFGPQHVVCDTFTAAVKRQLKEWGRGGGGGGKVRNNTESKHNYI